MFNNQITFKDIKIKGEFKGIKVLEDLSKNYNIFASPKRI